jgi:membrane protease YdiL (CAAX protease family)
MSEPETTAIVPQEPGWKAVFVGPDGVRAGWRLLLFVVVLILVGLASQLIASRLTINLAKDFSPKTVILGEVVAFAVILIVTLIVGKFEHRSLADYGLPFRSFLGKHFWAGAAWGFVMLSLIVALMMASHTYSLGGLALGPADIVKYGLLWAFAFLLVGFFEEFAFRGYIQYTLTTGLGFWPAAVLTCALFGFAHRGNPGETWVGLVEIFLIATFLCTALRRTGNLWFAIGWHMSFDWGESFFYSTPNSGIPAIGHMLNPHMMGSKWLNGGSVGPEASVFDVIVTVAGILLLLKVYPDAKYPAKRVEPPSAISPALEPAQPWTGPTQAQ